MPTVGTIEGQIEKVERFAVTLRRAKGDDLRDDKKGFKKYKWSKAAPGEWTVKRWKNERFQGLYPGVEVDVHDATGEPVHGKTLIKNVRRR